MNGSRRVGTITLGVFLVLSGILFLLNQFTNLLSYRFLLALWPSVFILLGLEILFYCFFNKEERLRYDGGAIFIIIVLSFFAVTMAGFEFFLLHAESFLRESSRVAGYLF